MNTEQPKQQTAVDWIVDQMLSEGHKEMWKDMIQQAKQMEKDQIINAHINGYDSSGGCANEYYNETFKK